MRSFLTTGALTAALLTTVNADLCSQGSQNINGNWYCQAVKRIHYTGVGTAGKYNKITSMNSATGACGSTPFSYSGPNAPLDEDISWHIRGPFNLKQFAVYYPGSGTTGSKKAKRSPHERRHDHAHFHKREKEILERVAVADKKEAAEKRAVGDVVVATINGQVVSWVNEYSGGAAPAAATGAPDVAAAAAPAPAAPTQASQPSSQYNSASVPAGDWGRAGYYNSETKTADGLVFLNNNGGEGSGVFDYSFGNSLSYATADGTRGCASPEVLAGSLPSNSEISIFSDKKCNGDCGYVRDGTVAYHGFEGANKAFFLEFMMPDDGKSGWNLNMPAAWILNAQIPRTLQYGKAECSCWTTGCAEFDVFEVLDSGNTRCKSTLHGNVSGGDSDYFDRPTSKYIKAAVVFRGNDIVIHLLEDDFQFGSSISGATIDSLFAESSVVKTSIFNVA